jgi:transcriptional regulator
MYIPAFNRMDDDGKIDHLIDRYGFATLITHKDGLPYASHLPVLLERTNDGARILRSHMARANPQWQHFDLDEETLCIFAGPHAYISPSWYKMLHTVPTWNYAVVHVYGRPTIVKDIGALRQIVLDTTAKYESRMPRPWQIPLSVDEIDEMLKAVVGFSIEVTRVEGKFKLGQNRSREDQEGMLKGLMRAPDATSRELGKFIATQSDGTSEQTGQNWP